ncbi:hypothetical protein [Kordiimonas sp.]|uniref:hypothetical protein n=1 Tax=Kordiimonas sp. TaxID=1970157 RepID=UPI003A8DAA9A
MVSGFEITGVVDRIMYVEMQICGVRVHVYRSLLVVAFGLIGKDQQGAVREFGEKYFGKVKR